ncbi:hypothetical protein [Pseudoalteromonas sp. S1612]|uniref:hypothetical protein n=1 Tax=Pseudoalteromonas sp. S1612 TaxID=579507 RepID=UPI00110AC18C|nr:hypothetical protein [Pseudoalteromonas sp. S1612]TMP55075.1 hypothetical protein CWB78_09580 [Pseudoalteromonas sp. S1612]
MTDWIDSKKILTWVKEDNEDLRNWLACHFENYNNYFKYPDSTLDSFIRDEIKRISDNQDSQKVNLDKLYKAWKSHERGLKNTCNKIFKLQLEVSKSARDRLKALSDADDLSQSKYIEKLINYARKNPKLISEDTKMQEPYKLNQRTFDNSAEIKAIRKGLSSIDVKITRLLDAREEKNKLNTTSQDNS